VPRLVGYYVEAPGRQVATAALAAHAASHLPDYMVPAIWVRLDALPLTPNGKLDRKALPPSDALPSMPARVTTPPRNPTEAKLAEIWKNVLGIHDVDVNDNLFSLGADSIHLFRIASRMIDQGIDLEAKHLLQHPTIAQLAVAANDLPVRSIGRDAAPSLRDFRRSSRAPSERSAS
jgi:aryl carrier-like protein